MYGLNDCGCNMGEKPIEVNVHKESSLALWVVLGIAALFFFKRK